MSNSSLITFPCHFPIKVIGKHTGHFEEDVITITKKHFPQITSNDFKYQASAQKNYICVTIQVYVLSQASLDALYHELTQYPDIKMVL